MKAITPTHGRPSCPDHLSVEAKKEFTRISDELDAMGILSTADRGVIAMYSQAWARWVKAERNLQEGEIVPSARTKVPQHSLWLTVSNAAQERMLGLAKELGLTPRSRRLMEKNNPAQEPKEAEDIFGSL